MTCTYEIPVLTFGASRMRPVISTKRMRLGVGETNPPSREVEKQVASALGLLTFGYQRIHIVPRCPRMEEVETCGSTAYHAGTCDKGSP
jgi:hypothetical protein